MSFNAYAWGRDGGTYGEASMRDLVRALSGGQAGVVGAPDALAVSQQASPTSTVKVAPGGYVIPATAAGESGSYTDWNHADLTSPAFAPTAVGVSRKDRLIVRITDGVSALEIVEGTAAASPVEPAITGDNFIELAMVTIPASTSNITDAMITDRRVRMAAGSRVIATSTTRPSTPFEGLEIYEADTNVVRVFDGSSWVPVATLGGWTSFTPTWSGVVLGTSPVSTGRYLVDGRRLSFEAALKLGSSTGNVTGTIEMAGPAGILARSLSAGLTGVPVVGTAWAIHAVAGSARYSAGFMAEPGTNKWVFRIGTGGGGAWDGTNPFNWDPADELYVAGVMEIS